MKTPLTAAALLGVLSFGPLAHAAGETCTQDTECAGREVCADGLCVLPASRATRPGHFSFAVGPTLELFPFSGSASQAQLAMLFGLRAGLGWAKPGWFRALAILEGGYAHAGEDLFVGDDGIFLGGGGEIDLALHDRIQPFLRATADFNAVTLKSSRMGTLADATFLLGLGVRLGFFEIHASLGSDYAGAFSLGVGLGVGGLH